MKKLLIILIVLNSVLSITNAQEFIGFDGYTVSDDTVTRQEWEMAASHRDEYNCHLDTTDWFRNKEAAEAVLRTFDDWEKEAYVWTDLSLTNIGTFQERGETIVGISYIHYMDAVFVENGIADTCRISGAICGTYSKDGAPSPTISAPSAKTRRRRLSAASPSSAYPPRTFSTFSRSTTRRRRGEYRSAMPCFAS